MSTPFYLMKARCERCWGQSGAHFGRGSVAEFQADGVGHRSLTVPLLWSLARCRFQVEGADQVERGVTQ